MASTDTAPDPRRFAGLNMADAIALVVAEGQAEIAAEAEAEADRLRAWKGE